MKTLFIVLIIVFTGCSSSGEISTQNNEPCYSIEECTMALVTKIERNWRRPVETEDLEATAIIEISDSGEVSKFDIENSSGDSNFDESIRKAVYSASPFSELEGLSKKDLEKFDKVKLIFKQK